MSTEEKPLHVGVAEKLGCSPTRLERRGRVYWRCGCRGSRGSVHDAPGQDGAPHEGLELEAYDKDWLATGPLIERLKISLRSPDEPEATHRYWVAYCWVYPLGWDNKNYHDVQELDAGSGDGPLVAVCKLILKMPDHLVCTHQPAGRCFVCSM